MKAYQLLLGLFVVAIALFFLTPRVHPSRIGDLAPESYALRFGFRSGDQVVSFDGTPLETWEELELNWDLQKGRPVKFEIVRDGKPLTLEVPSLPTISFREFGFRFYSAPAIAALKIHSPLLQLGVQEGDLILAVEGKTISDFREFESALASHPSGQPLNLDLKRKISGEKYSIGVATIAGDPSFDLSNLGLIHPRNVTAVVRRGSIGARLGLQPGDRFVLVQGQPSDSKFKAVRFIESLKAERKLKIAVIRRDKVQHLEAPANLSVPEHSDLEMILDKIGVTTLSESGPSNDLKLNLHRVALSWRLLLREYL